MSDTTEQMQALIDRLAQGDESAREQLIERAYERLRRLAAGMFHRSFPALSRRHELDSVLSDTYLRLRQALESVRPSTVAEFFGLAARKIRHVLLDMIERQKRLDERHVEAAARPEAVLAQGDDTHDPAELALWTEFHRVVTELPEQERTVVELRFYGGLTNEEIARLLKLPPRKVSYLWVAATERLADSGALPGNIL
jgi:RNA polymerase sigma factor (sigma-70 family)